MCSHHPPSLHVIGQYYVHHKWVCFLFNVNIVNPFRASLVLQVTIYWGMVATITIEAKDKLYHDQHPKTCL
jgi:hypothetical protein